MIALLFACSSPTLTLDGPAEVHVFELGPVDGPKAALSSGEPATGLVWTSDTLSVAGVDADKVTAVGPGKTTITGTWQAQSVQWALFVEPPITLVILDPPATVTVGQTVALRVTGRLSDGAVPVADVAWKSNDEALATVDPAGTVTGKAPGTVYISATNGKSEAMVELDVVAP